MKIEVPSAKLFELNTTISSKPYCQQCGHDLHVPPCTTNCHLCVVEAAAMKEITRALDQTNITMLSGCGCCGSPFIKFTYEGKSYGIDDVKYGDYE